MNPRKFWVTKAGAMWNVNSTVPNSKPELVASFLTEGQAVMLATTLNNLDGAVEEARTLLRRQRAQLVTVGNALFALLREIVVKEGPPAEIVCSPEFPRVWNEGMELLVVLAQEGIPSSSPAGEGDVVLAALRSVAKNHPKPNAS